MSKWQIDSYVNWAGNRMWRVWTPRGHLLAVYTRPELARGRFVEETEGKS